MMCPNQHPVAAGQDYCDECGSRVVGNATAVDTWTCQYDGCDTVQSLSRFCEACGQSNPMYADYTEPERAPEPAPEPVAPQVPHEASRTTVWLLQTAADRVYFDHMISGTGSAIVFPAVYPPRQFTITGQSVVGRRSASRGIEPDIDLSGAPEDPGVSHVHAVFTCHGDGSLTVIDVGSANGTYINGSQDPLPTNTPVVLNQGDTVHVGAWTRFTVAAS